MAEVETNLIDIRTLAELPYMEVSPDNFFAQSTPDGQMGHGVVSELIAMGGGGGGGTGTGTGLTPDQATKLDKAIIPTPQSPIQATGIWLGTQSQYDAIPTKTASVLYLIKFD